MNYKNLLDVFHPVVFVWIQNQNNFTRRKGFYLQFILALYIYVELVYDKLINHFSNFAFVLTEWFDFQ